MSMNITSADATAVVNVDELYPAGFPLEQFATDQSVTQDETTFSESRMGVDGKHAAGFTPTLKVVNVSLEASSPSIPYLDTLIKAMESGKRVYKLNMVFTVPSIGKVYNYTNGVLTKGKPLPDAKKILDPQTFTFTFESLAVQPL